ncbi:MULTISPECIES: hypothetical protein [unclassified Devosia]|jgi:hypothetical protein|uniref:hypothetical protein n=1 Tax=unclassified Devosia TaxID=196773 RepID=UPI000868842F|nr:MULTISPECIES: hypothetical protein [unclassified Devosia]MBN9363461.1 hypothetical protein [Devosia sp.]ODS95044.1 MAG: hypothetical protein ABS47_04445 [Devosia sp. SCN 66-27]OJX25278.1 MAG: hypothetical protein BGO83_10470 [Devosia sp. 66-14]
MAAHSPSPEIFWVIGPDTHVGKTTIAAALIRSLNRQGCPTVGFKPFGGFLLQEAMEFGAGQVRRSGCEVCGGDAERLASASPLTPLGMMDVVGPLYMVSYPVYGRPVLMRIGSRAFGNVRYLYHDHARGLLERSDVVELLREVGVPLDAMEATTFGFLDAPALSTDAHASAYGRLLALEPRAVVVEGASNHLPIWKAGLVNHVLLVTGEAVSCFARINLEVPFSSQLKMTQSIFHHLKVAPRPVRVPMTLAPPEGREEAALVIVDQLLEQAGLPARQQR